MTETKIRAWGTCVGDLTLHAATILSCFFLGTPLERIAFTEKYGEGDENISIKVDNNLDIHNPADQETMLLYVLTELIRLKKEQNFNFCHAQFKTEEGQRYAHLSGFIFDTDGEDIESISCEKLCPKEEGKEGHIVADLIFKVNP
jgi:hypothetical protein